MIALFEGCFYGTGEVPKVNEGVPSPNEGCSSLLTSNDYFSGQ